ncbi:MAG: thioredoxin family protein [Verrucomicrobiales bacterium]
MKFFTPQTIFLSTTLAALSALLLAVSLSWPTPSRAEKAGPEFEDNFETAREAAEEAGKPLIVIFSASWCAPCQQMKSSVYPSEEVQPYHESFVWAYLDADKEENRPLMAQFGVSGIPHITFFRADGSAIGQFAGAVDPLQFTKILTKVLDAADNPSDSDAKG